MIEITDQQLTDEQLLEWDSQGFIPGPQENETEFLRRVDFCKNLEKHMQETQGQPFPFSQDNQKSLQILQEALPLTQKLFGINLFWVPLYFSNHQLAPWHGGCGWIFQMTEESPIAAILQLRKTFYSNRRYLGIYERDELIAHELSHVGRMAFQEPQYEEILAYQTSKSSFRRWFGPVLQSAKETLFLVVLLGLLVTLDFYFLFSGNDFLYDRFMWLKLIPIIFILAALTRLWTRQYRFKACLQKLKQTIAMGEEGQEISINDRAHAMIYRLTDEEIQTFSTLSPQAVRTRILENENQSLRHRLIRIYLQTHCT